MNSGFLLNFCLGVLKFSTLLDHYAPDLKVKFDKFAAEILEPVAKRLTWDFEKGEGMA